MRIYTRNGDKGQTQIYADKVERKAKDAIELECYGTLDELNAHVGMLLTYEDVKDHQQTLQHIQQQLFQIGFALSANSQLQPSDIEQLEQHIDQLQSDLPAQKCFILPGGGSSAAQAHICRTVSRRAERRLVTLSAEQQIAEYCLAYINRLSDYFFVLARHLNFKAGIKEPEV